MELTPEDDIYSIKVVENQLHEAMASLDYLAGKWKKSDDQWGYVHEGMPEIQEVIEQVLRLYAVWYVKRHQFDERGT